MSDGGADSGFDRGAAADESRALFERLWSEGDPWELETSELDLRRYDRQLELLAGRRYRRALEIGCGAGAFTRRLAPLCEELVALDISQHALAKAEAAGVAGPGVTFRLANVMEVDFDQEGTWDLVVVAETAYYLGWRYPMFDVGWLAHALHEATDPGGRLLLVNTVGTEHGIMSPWLIRTYRDLFANAGYEVESDETLRGVKETVEFEILVTLFRKAP